MTAPLSDSLTLCNGESVEVTSIPQVLLPQFTRLIVQAVADGQRVSALFADDAIEADATDLYAILSDDGENRLQVVRTTVEGDQYESLTPHCPQVHLFEREIAEQYGLHPENHPWFKPVRYCASWREGRDAWDRVAGQPIVPGSGEFYHVAGEQVHEVAVGPVHAGVIEPGHFRFQCHGEEVFHLEIALGYQHRGIEEAMIGGPGPRSIHYAETLAGDTTIGHATAYAQVLEALTHCTPPARAQVIRGIALELERLANHVGDLGALALDVGFLPTSAYCGRIRGDFLNLTAQFCGNRFGRGLVRPGGVGFDAEPARVAEMLTRLDAHERDVTNAVNLLWNAPSAMARFEDTGPLPMEVARQLGIVGPAARASGINRDVRQDQPSGIYRFVQIPVSTWESCDVFARAYVRWMEIRQSIEFVREQLRALPGGEVRRDLGELAPGRLAVALVEGWRGEICHVGITDPLGEFSRYKIVDPSFHNWPGLAHALRSQQISDFPICNKSFNLSYCGHDL